MERVVASEFVAQPSLWSGEATGAYGALTVLPGTGPQFEVLRVLGDVAGPQVYRPVSAELAEAVAALETLEPSDRIGVGAGGGADALAAASSLQHLVRALEAEGEDFALAVPSIRDYVADPPRLRDDLEQAIAAYVRSRIAEDSANLCTFSLILFRSTDFGGAIEASLLEERAEWRAHLTPRTASGADLHLAIVPPPTASEGVMSLATELGCEELVPCVAFLGEKPDETLTEHPLLTRLSARRLVAPPPSVPNQLHDIYSTVYGGHAIAPGKLWTATGGKYVAIAGRRVNPRVLLTLLAGAVGGSGLVSALNAVFDVIVT